MSERIEAARSPTGVLRDRRLAAVVFTDVVGYSAMVQADEAASIERVRADMARMREACAAHGGEFLNAMGDGLMLAFSSAVEAVQFAVEVQEAFARRNEGVDPAARLQHRIGIHVGDVFRTADGLLAGDGVNIAARLQTDSPPGGLCVSQAVRDLVRGKAAFDPRFAGAKVFKNIADPVPVWHWHPREEAGVAAQAMPPTPAWRRRGVLAGGIAVAGAAAVGGAFVMLRGRFGGGGADGPRSVAVLPFASLSDEKEASYFADGIHEDLLTQLALLGNLKVVSRTSVMEYRNTTKKLPQIGSELKVDAVVEGSVRKAGNIVRVTAQLVDAQADKHLWAANYDRDLKDVFTVQNELAKEIARSLDVSLTAAEEKRLARAPTQNLQAYEYYLKHEQLVRETAGSYRSVTSVNERVDLLQKAVDMDPTFAVAWARLAGERARSRGYGMADDREGQVALARQAIAKAKSLTPDDPQVKVEEAVLHLHGLDDQKGSIRLYEEVLRDSPYNVDALYGISEVLWELNRQAQCIPHLERALGVDVRHGPSLTRLAAVYLNYRQFDKALDLRKRLIARQPDNVDLHAALHHWTYWSTGSWESFDAWRRTLAPGVELRSARVRNADADRAIARRDYAEVHRLIDVDSQDWKRDPKHREVEEAGLAVLHALAWRAQGDPARAGQSARDALSGLRTAEKKDPDFDSWFSVGQMHALLGDAPAASEAFGKYLAQRTKVGNLWQIELARRSECFMAALMGNGAAAIEMLRKQSRRVGFRIHNVRLALEFAPLWDTPDFKSLVEDPATNAPLPLDAPFTGT